jgi:predicted ABC-type transport system involved in lysophospholipase L1 biosynthesis ATPase subunit
MGTVLPSTQHESFDSAVADAMGLAFDTAWQKLLVSGTVLASSGYAEATRGALAMHIIDLAKRGERDVNRLRDDAVAFVLQAPQSKPPSNRSRTRKSGTPSCAVALNISLRASTKRTKWGSVLSGGEQQRLASLAR